MESDQTISCKAINGISRRKAAANASLNIIRKNTNLWKVRALLRKKKTNSKLSDEDEKFLSTHGELVKQFYKRREKRAVLLKRQIEQEDSPKDIEEKCLKLAQAIHDAEFLVVYTGAGISTAASIPDYRGPNGIWTRLQKGKDIGTHDLTTAEPTLTHMAISHLFSKGIVRHTVSQNCDGLHLRSGLPKTSLSEVHGNMYIEVCKRCVPARDYVRIFDVTEKTSKFKHTTGRRCYRCGEPLIDTIVHFGERGKLRWPLNWQGACQAAKACDTILCLGSSLKVLRKYPWLWQMDRPQKKRPQLFIVNLQWTPKDKEATIKINGKCDDVMSLVMKNLGFETPQYVRDEDPIFQISTALHADELSTISGPFIDLPKSESPTGDYSPASQTDSEIHSQQSDVKSESLIDSDNAFLNDKSNAAIEDFDEKIVKFKEEKYESGNKEEIKGELDESCYKQALRLDKEDLEDKKNIIKIEIKIENDIEITPNHSGDKGFLGHLNGLKRTLDTDCPKNVEVKSIKIDLDSNDSEDVITRTDEKTDTQELNGDHEREMESRSHVLNLPLNSSNLFNCEETNKLEILPSFSEGLSSPPNKTNEKPLNDDFYGTGLCIRTSSSAIQRNSNEEDSIENTSTSSLYSDNKSDCATDWQNDQIQDDFECANGDEEVVDYSLNFDNSVVSAQIKVLDCPSDVTYEYSFDSASITSDSNGHEHKQFENTSNGPVFPDDSVYNSLSLSPTGDVEINSNNEIESLPAVGKTIITNKHFVPLESKNVTKKQQSVNQDDPHPSNIIISSEMYIDITNSGSILTDNKYSSCDSVFLLHTKLLDGIICSADVKTVNDIKNGEKVNGSSSLVLNGQKDLDKETDPELKSLWYSKFCSVPMKKKKMRSSSNYKTGRVVELDDDVKKLWFWGFDSSSVEKPAKRLTRSTYQKALSNRIASGVIHCNCLTANPNLCRSAKSENGAQPLDSIMLKARASARKRRQVNYRKFQPVFQVILESLTYERQRIKRTKRCFEDEEEVEEEDEEDEEYKDTADVPEEELVSEPKKKIGEIKVVPGWYGKGYRKIIRKKKSGV